MLTKSNFKKALECPTKLYYALNQFPDSKKDDAFLQSLAEGGVQVGELAKLRYPEGIEVTEIDKDLAVAKTKELLESGSDVVIFEGAFKVGHRFARVDILVKSGNQIQVIEVKSTSIKPDEQLNKKRGRGILSGWFSYVADVAFQRQLVADALPVSVVSAHLMVMDKSAVALKSGLNSMFKIKRDSNDRVYCEVDPKVNPSDVESLMKIVDVDNILGDLEKDDFFKNESERMGASTFSEFVKQCEDDVIGYLNGKPARETPISKTCGSCEFNVKGKSGQHTCWAKTMGWEEAEFEKPKVWDLWQYRNPNKAISEGLNFIEDLNPQAFESKGSYGPRQAVQIQGTINQEEFVNEVGLASAIAKSPAPWHFIDFETSAPAIPFFEGLSPYEGLCFQFSHHVMEENGEVRHENQFLASDSDVDPTYAFVDALYNALAHTEGTIFRYADHENSFLRMARERLAKSSPFDEEHTARLIEFVDSITEDRKNNHVGSRNMVDLLKIVKENYWHPRMGSSNSIKYVLPAAMESSLKLKERYSNPVYGSESLPSLNLSEGKSWFVVDESGKVASPYDLLPSIDELYTSHIDKSERLFGESTLGNGGAAMTAFSYLQQPDISPVEKSALCEALLQYCELDTLAMVFIWEYFLELTDDGLIQTFRPEFNLSED